MSKRFYKWHIYDKKPGYYTLIENIKFNPKNDKPSYEFIKKNPQFFLGWFCAISICCDNVILDLNKFTISQDIKFYVKQRFFMVIELANSALFHLKGQLKTVYQIILFYLLKIV